MNCSSKKAPGISDSVAFHGFSYLLCALCISARCKTVKVM